MRRFLSSLRPAVRSSRSRVLLEALEPRLVFGYSGAIFTTLPNCTAVNWNIYDLESGSTTQQTIDLNKMDVYLNGGPSATRPDFVSPGTGLIPAHLPPSTNFYVQVTDPSGKVVLGSSYIAPKNGQGGDAGLNNYITTDSTGKLPCTQIWAIVGYRQGNQQGGAIAQGFQNTPNPGGEYKVWIAKDTPDFSPSNTKTDNFKIKPPRECGGMKCHDHNGNGVHDAGDEPVAGVTMFLDDNNNGKLDWADGNANGIWDSGEGEQWTLTSTLGFYSFDVPAGKTTRVREVNPPGWTRTNANPPDFTMPSVGKVDNGILLNSCNINIGGEKFNDRNANGIDDGSGEPGIGGVTIYVDVNNNGSFDSGEPSAVTAPDGSYTIPNVTVIQSGYTVREVVPNGWTQTTGNPHVDCSSGVNVTGVDFGNRQNLAGNRMTGGGSIYIGAAGTPAGAKTHHGFELHCADPATYDAAKRNHLEINSGGTYKFHFHLTDLTAVTCLDLLPASAPDGIADTLLGTGTGNFSGLGAGNRVTSSISFVLTDDPKTRGGKNDQASYIIRVNGSIVADTGGLQYLTFGNHATHKEIPNLTSDAANVLKQIDLTFGQLDNTNLTDDKLATLTQQLLDLQTQFDLLTST